MSADIFNERSGTVIAVALMSKGLPRRAGSPLTQELGFGRLTKPAWIKISQIRTLSLGLMGPQAWGRVSGGSGAGHRGTG